MIRWLRLILIAFLCAPLSVLAQTYPSKTIRIVVGGQLQLLFTSLASIAPHLQSGKVKVIAVTGRSRYDGLPNVPTVAETLPGFEMSSWRGFFAPAGLPRPILTRLYGEIETAVNAPDVKPKLETAGLLVSSNPSEQFAAQVRPDYGQRGRLITAAGIEKE